MSSTWNSPLFDQYGSSFKAGQNDGCQCAASFTDFESEYKAIRDSVAISDNCHYGKFRISGADALDVVNGLVMADIARLAIGRATWTFMLNEDASPVCDVYVVCAGDEYLVFSEGVAPSTVKEQLEAAAEGHSAKVEDQTQEMALIGLDGPYAWELLKDLVGVRVLGLRYLEFLERQPLGDGQAYVIRAGKTGEFGYQILVPAAQVADVWAKLKEAGKAYDAEYVGYEALLQCRLENRFINMHREGVEASNPLELNCRVMVDREKEDYVGADSLLKAMEGAAEKRIVGMVIEGDASHTPALGADVTVEDQVFGRIVNAGYSPLLGKPVALALLDASVSYAGLDFDVQAADGSVSAKTVSAPFVFNKSLVIRPQEDSYHSRS